MVPPTTTRGGLRVLVTGATGFVGGAVVRALTGAEVAVRVFARDPTRLGALQSRVESTVVGHLDDVKQLEEAVSGCDVVLHVAGMTKAWRSSEFIRVNEGGARNVARAVLRANRPPARLVLVSSLAAAGPSLPHRPRVESDPCTPVSLYGRSKLLGEIAVREVLTGSGVETVIVRPPIVYGEGDRDVLAVIRQVARGIVPVVGGAASLGKSYSLVHVDDLARALEAACFRREAAGETYFVPGPRDATLEEMLTAIEEAVGRRARRIPVPLPVARVAATAAQAWGALRRRATLVNCDKLREAAAPGWQCSGAAAAVALGHAPRIDYPEGFARQAAFARARKDL